LAEALALIPPVLIDGDVLGFVRNFGGGPFYAQT
jgi:hypothetical protein